MDDSTTCEAPVLNLNTTFPIKCDDHAINALPVLVDLNWIGSAMTSDNAGIVPSRAAVARPVFSTIDTSEVIL